jgi:hypothetical protein
VVSAALSTGERARGAGAAASRWIENVPPWRVLVVFLATQWALVAGIALSVRHNRWIYYQGGDQLWYYTGGWLLAHGRLGQPLVGLLWTAIDAPIAAIAGPNIANGYPAIVLFDVIVLLPVALLALYGTARLIGGRRFGYLTVFLWIAIPLIGIRFTDQGYHMRYTELTLPQAFGLTAMADFPTMVAAIVAAYFCARTVLSEAPRSVDAVAGGIAAGAAVSIKPATALFLLGPALAYLVSRRGRLAGCFLIGMLPALLALAVWKYRGYGHLPILNSAGSASSLGGGGVNRVVGGVNTHYLDFHWSHFTHELDQIREHFWSLRIIEWLVIAGLIGLGRRSRVGCALVGGWFGAFVVVKGGYANAGIEDASLLRLLIPTIPAFTILIASVPYLVPGSTRAVLEKPVPTPNIFSLRTSWALVGIAATATGVGPLALVARASPMQGRPSAAVIQTPLIPMGVDVGQTAVAHGTTVTLSWRPQHPSGGPVFYHIFRGRVSQQPFACIFPSPPAEQCKFTGATDLGTTMSPTFVDRRVPRGRWVYRVGIAANWLNDVRYGDVYVVSAPTVVKVP